MWILAIDALCAYCAYMCDKAVESEFFKCVLDVWSRDWDWLYDKLILIASLLVVLFLNRFFPLYVVLTSPEHIYVERR